MTKRLRVLLMVLAAPFAAVTPAFGQSNFSVSYTLADGNAHALGAGTNIAFPSVDINATTPATVIIANSGLGAGTVSGLSVTGTAFRLVNSTLLPATINPNQTFVFGIVFAPTQTGSFTGTFSINLGTASISGTLTGATPPPNFSLNYVDPATNNTITLANQATLQFPNTLVGATTTVTLLASNTGAGTGAVTSVALSGAPTAFQLVLLPPLPVSVGPSQQLSFGVRFTPLEQQVSTDVLTVNLNGQVTTINLKAQGIQPIYSYQFSGGTGPATVSAGGTVAVPNTSVGQTTVMTVTVTNTGLGAGQVSAIGVTGAGLSLSNLPILPVTLQPNGTQQFTLSFSPAQPGAITGRLTFGSDIVSITATGLGPQLTYAYTSGSSAIPVTAGDAVIFTPLAVGSTESLTFSIQNTGTSAATISSINLAVTGTIFSLSGLPSMPSTLNPGGTITFPVSFTPNNTGNLTATLLVNSSSFSLSGNGTQPSPLPAYSFQGLSANEQPDQQPGVGLTLASPYPMPLQGTLTLTFDSNVFSDDTSIQFANGGRTVNFTIPANTTQALFNGNATTVALQTGTTSGNIVITPSFGLSNGFNLTPASPSVYTVTIPRSAPQVLSGSVSSAAADSLTLVLSGYTTTRTLTQFNVQFTAVQGQTFNPANLAINVSSASAAWFQGSAAEGFGGSFLVAITFVLSNGSSTANLVQLLQSLSITATNEVGTSSALAVPIQ